MQSLCVCFAFIGMEMMQSAVSVTKNTLWLVPAGIIHSQHFQAHNQTSVGLFREAAERSTWTKANRTNPNTHEGSHRVRNMAAYERFICSELGWGWSGYNQPSAPCFLHEQRDQVSDRFTRVFVWIWFLWARTSAPYLQHSAAVKQLPQIYVQTAWSHVKYSFSRPQFPQTFLDVHEMPLNLSDVSSDLL